jgi:hypothetical protein
MHEVIEKTVSVLVKTFFFLLITNFVSHSLNNVKISGKAAAIANKLYLIDFHHG